MAISSSSAKVPTSPWPSNHGLATAIHDYIELFHNTRRRHSALGMLCPTDYEANYLNTHTAA